MSDLRHLTKLLNELKPAFLELTTSHGPPGSPVIEMETYTKDHIALEMPPISVAGANNDPTTITISNTPNDYIGLGMSSSTPSTMTMPSALASEIQFIPLPALSHNSQLEITPITLTAMDTITGAVSSVNFNFLGYGFDSTLTNPTVPPSPAQAVPWNLYNNDVLDNNLGPGMSQQSLAALIEGHDPPPAPIQSPPPPASIVAGGPDPIGIGASGGVHYIEGNMPIGTDGSFGGRWGHHR